MMAHPIYHHHPPPPKPDAPRVGAWAALPNLASASSCMANSSTTDARPVGPVAITVAMARAFVRRSAGVPWALEPERWREGTTWFVKTVFLAAGTVGKTTMGNRHSSMKLHHPAMSISHRERSFPQRRLFTTAT